MPSPIGTTNETGPLIQTPPLTVGRMNAQSSGGIARAADSASFSGISTELGELSTLLSRLQSGFAKARVSGIASVQDELDQIRSAFHNRSARHERGGGYRVRQLSDDISNLVLEDAFGTRPSEVIPLEMTLTQPPEPAALFFQISGGFIDLTAGSSVTIQIVGNAGARTLSFASTQTVGQVVAAINAFSGAIGAVAEADGTGSGFTLQSTAAGSGEYVSVRSIEGEANVRVGLAETPSQPNPSLNPIHTLTLAFDDLGVDAEGSVNGFPIWGYGDQVRFGYGDYTTGRFGFGGFDLRIYDVDEDWATPRIIGEIRGTYAERRD